MSEPERTAPESFLLLKFGANVYIKYGKQGGFDFDDASADALIAEFNSRSRDLVIDFEHSTLSGNEAPAAGSPRSSAFIPRPRPKAPFRPE